MNNELILYSDNKLLFQVCVYLYEKYENEFNIINYNEVSNTHAFDYKSRRTIKKDTNKKVTPSDCNVNIKYNNQDIIVNIETLYNNNNEIKTMLIAARCSSNDIILQKLTLKSNNKKILIQLVDDSIKFFDNMMNESKKKITDTIRTFYWRIDYWALFSKVPKRSIDTLHLKKGMINNTMNIVNKFLHEDTRTEYINYGIPYKCVFLLHGVPGGGKTSLINCIASNIDADIHYIPITSELKDTELINAFSELSIQDDNESRNNMIVIEDIDCLFNDRKLNDHNNISLQTLLNCLDGMTCIEGTLLFLTANKPEVLDYALIRSSRIDHKIKFDYADKYQTKQMFQKFISNIEFDDFYKLINNKKYTMAMLQDFLFHNRYADNLLDLLPEFNKMIDNNDPKNLETIIESNKNNLYM
jgi:SpoVK/Ycf46/Vps4 family AAA+-type ATPase